MSDLVERLREFSIEPTAHPVHPGICTEAAAEIERLNASLLAAAEYHNQLEDILRRIANWQGCECDSYAGFRCELCKIREAARAAGGER